MSLKCLAVDSDLDIAGFYIKEWAERGIIMDRVDTMTEAIVKLMHDDYIFVGINGDATDFMPFLKEMRSVTDIPIMIVTSNFDTQTEIEALNNGANLYARWHDTPEDNVSSVLAHIARMTDDKPATRKIMYYNGLLISLIHRSVFVGKEQKYLTRQEYDLLLYLMMNHGVPLSYEKIIKHVWVDEYDDIARDVLRNAVKRLREKLGTAPDGSEYIETVRDYGYRFPYGIDK